VDTPGKVTYVVDEGIIKFGKFAGAVLTLFLLVGTYLFNIKLEVTVERMREAQKELQESQAKLKELEETAADVQADVERASQDARSLLSEIEGNRDASVVLLAELRVLSPDQKANLDETRKAAPDRFRSGNQAKLWQIGSTIRIRFLEGTEAQKNKFRQAIGQWQPHMNLKIDFTDDSRAEVKVAFKRNDGSWSFIGTDSVAIPATQASINLGFDEEQAVPATYVHEIGHMLGLAHEFKNPRAALKWDRNRVYKLMGAPPNSWDKATIDRNFFSAEVYPGNRDFDPLSIMMNAFPAEYFTDKKGFDAPTKISESDTQYIATLYPK